MITIIGKFSAYGFLKNLRFFEPFFYLYFISKGFSYTKIGLLISIREMTAYMFEIPSGIFSDYYSPKRSLILCFFLYIFSFFTIHVSSNIFWVSAFGMFVFGIAESFRSGTHKAIIINHLENSGQISKKHEIYGYTRSWSLIGSSISALISGLLVFYSGNYNLLFISSTIPYFLIIFLIFSYPTEIRTIKNNNSIKTHTYSLISQFKDRDLIKAIINTSIFEADFKFTKDLIQPIIKSSLAVYLVNEMTINRYSGIILALIYFFIYIFSSYFSKRSHKIFSNINLNEKDLMNYSLLIFALFTLFCGIGLFFEKYYIIPIILLSLNFCLFNLRKPLGISFITGMTSKEHRATVLSVEAQIKTVFLSVFAVISGVLIDNFGMNSAFFFISGTILLIQPMIILRNKKKDRR